MGNSGTINLRRLFYWNRETLRFVEFYSGALVDAGLRQGERGRAQPGRREPPVSGPGRWKPKLRTLPRGGAFPAVGAPLSPAR